MMTMIRFIGCTLVFTTIFGCNSRNGNDFEKSRDSESFFNNGFWKIGFFVLFVLITFYLINKLIKRRKKKLNKNEENHKTQGKNNNLSKQNDSLMNDARQFQMNEKRLNRKIFDLEQENKKLKEKISLLQKNTKVDEDIINQSLMEEESISNPIELSVPNVIANQTSESSILYAGKPSQDGEFANIHTSINEIESVFKLTVKNENQAEFEVIIPSKILEKYITNAPSDFLYRVCNHVNSNREFTKEIITLKKGVAELVDGRWIVKEENKALIKFQ